MAEILVAGASGFVGRRLVSALEGDGHHVRAMTRHPETYDGAGDPVHGDVHRPETLAEPFDGAEIAYYLVHSLDEHGFEEKEADAARAFGTAAAAAGVRQIVFLGGLGSDDDDLSAHLRSRRAVERLLGVDGVPVTVLRAGIIVGHGGISWEITRQLVKNLPAMVVPSWARTRTQPIGIDDMVAYLVGVAGNSEAVGRVFEVGGPDQLSYVEMLQVAAEIDHGARVPLVEVPVLTPRLSSYWLALVTDVDATTGRNLIDSMSVEVLVTDDSIRDVVPLEPVGYGEAVRRALEDRRQSEQGQPSTGGSA